MNQALQEVYSLNPDCSALSMFNALCDKIIQAKAMAACFYTVDVDETKPEDIQTYMLSLESLLSEAIELSSHIKLPSENK